MVTLVGGALGVILVYTFVFGVAALIAWVLRYWFVVIPRRHPRARSSRD